MRDRDAHISAAEKARRDVLDVDIGWGVGVHADRPEAVSGILRKGCRGTDTDEEHLARVRDGFHRRFEPIVVDCSDAFGDGVRRGGEDFEQHDARRVRVGDIAVVERLIPRLARQHELKVAIASVSHALAAADHRRG